MRLPGPVRIGLESVKANAVPMVVLWTMAALMVLAYYRVSEADAVFGPLAKWQTESGWIAAFLNRVVFCGVIPGTFLLSVKSIRPPRSCACSSASPRVFRSANGGRTDSIDIINAHMIKLCCFRNSRKG